MQLRLTCCVAAAPQPEDQREGTNSKIVCSASHQMPWEAPLTSSQAVWEADVRHRHCHRLGDGLQSWSYLLVFIKLYFIAATAIRAGHLQRIVALLRWLIAWPLASCFITPFDISYNYCLESFTTYLCCQLLQFNMPSISPDQPLYTPRKNSPFTHTFLQMSPKQGSVHLLLCSMHCTVWDSKTFLPLSYVAPIPPRSCPLIFRLSLQIDFQQPNRLILFSMSPKNKWRLRHTSCWLGGTSAWCSRAACWALWGPLQPMLVCPSHETFQQDLKANFAVAGDRNHCCAISVGFWGRGLSHLYVWWFFP